MVTMSKQNDPDDRPDTPPPGAERTFRDALRGLRRAASEVAEAGAEEARKLAEIARPEVERRARQAKAAADAARPHLEQKAREATDYVRDHQDEIVRASKRGAGVAASGAASAVTPGPLRPAVDAMKDELRKPSEEATANADGDADHVGGAATGNAETATSADPPDPTDPTDPP